MHSEADHALDLGSGDGRPTVELDAGRARLGRKTPVEKAAAPPRVAEPWLTSILSSFAPLYRPGARTCPRAPIGLHERASDRPPEAHLGGHAAVWAETARAMLAR